jgi:hypothetical protein
LIHPIGGDVDCYRLLVESLDDELDGVSMNGEDPTRREAWLGRVR